MIIIKETEIVRALTAMRDVLDTNNYFKDIFRWIGWKLIEGLKWIVDGIEGAVNTMYDALSFSATEIMTKHTLTEALFFSVMVGSIMILGYKLMFNRESSKSNSFTGTLLVLVLCMGLPMIFSAGLSMFNRGAGVGKLNDQKLSDTTIMNNITDFTTNIVANDFGFENGVYKKLDVEIPLESIKYIDSSESLNEDALKALAKEGGVYAKINVDALKHELHYDSKGIAEAKKFNTSKIIMGKDGYYRYQISWFSIIATLIIVGFTLVLMSIKTAKILFQLVLDKIVGTILMLTDLQEGKRAKELLTHVIATFTILLVSLVSINIYIELISVLATQLSGITNTFAFLLALAGASLALLEGSQVVEKLMGTRVDSGLTRTVAGMYVAATVAKAPVKLAMGAGKLAKGAGKLGKRAGEKFGGKSESDNPKSCNPISLDQTSMEGFEEKAKLSAPKNSTDAEQSGGGTKQGESVGTGFKDEEGPSNTGFSLKEPNHNTGALGNQGNSNNTEFSTNQGDLGELSNTDSSSSYGSRNESYESFGAPGVNNNSRDNNNNNNSDLDFNDALRNHQLKGGSKANRKPTTENKRNRGKYQL